MENRDWLLYLGHQNTTPFDVTGALCDLFDVSINIYHGKFTSRKYWLISLNAVSRC